MITTCKNRSGKLHDNRGFTMLEMLIASVMLMALLGTIGQFYIICQNSVIQGTTAVHMQQNATQLLNRLSELLLYSQVDSTSDKSVNIQTMIGIDNDQPVWGYNCGGLEPTTTSVQFEVMQNANSPVIFDETVDNKDYNDDGDTDDQFNAYAMFRKILDNSVEAVQYRTRMSPYNIILDAGDNVFSQNVPENKECVIVYVKLRVASRASNPPSILVESAINVGVDPNITGG